MLAIWASTTALVSMAAGCQVSLDLSGERFRCAEPPLSCPDGQTCVSGECVSLGTDPDAQAASGFQRTLTVSAQLSSAAEVPVLIELDPSRIDYSVTGPAGEALQFLDESGTALEHEIASWDVAGVSQVWVRFPQLETGATVSMRYGTEATSVEASGATVWSDHGLSVHFENGSTDSSPEANELQLQGGAEISTGLFGGGVELDGVDDYIEIGSDLATFQAATGATLSAWVNTTSTVVSPVIEYSNGTATSSRLFLGFVAGTIPRLGVLTEDAQGTTESIQSETISTGEWHWLLGTVDLEAATITLYVDGALAETAGLSVAAEMFPNTASSVAVIGRNDTSSVGFLAARVDEARVLARPVGASYVRAQYLSMTGGLFAFGPEQPL